MHVLWQKHFLCLKSSSTAWLEQRWTGRAHWSGVLNYGGEVLRRRRRAEKGDSLSVTLRRDRAWKGRVTLTPQFASTYQVEVPEKRRLLPLSLSTSLSVTPTSTSSVSSIHTRFIHDFNLSRLTTHPTSFFFCPSVMNDYFNKEDDKSARWLWEVRRFLVSAKCQCGCVPSTVSSRPWRA